MPMDLKSYARWYDYSRARDDMFRHTDVPWAPWIVVPSDVKKRARLNVIRHISNVAITEGVAEIIAGKSKRDPAELQGSDWLDELGIELLEVVEMIFELEDRFGVEIPVNANSAGREFKTVGDIVLLVEKLVAAKGST